MFQASVSGYEIVRVGMTSRRSYTESRAVRPRSTAGPLTRQLIQLDSLVQLTEKSEVGSFFGLVQQLHHQHQ